MAPKPSLPPEDDDEQSEIGDPGGRSNGDGQPPAGSGPPSASGSSGDLDPPARSDGEADGPAAGGPGESGEGYELEADEDREMQTVVTVEITGLSLYTHHGVTPAEREVGQRLVFDLRLDVGESDATVTDQLEDTVDYAEVCQLVALITQQRSYATLERLCSAVADRLLADFGLEGVSVKAAKPEPPIPLPVEEVSVEVWREPGE